MLIPLATDVLAFGSFLALVRLGALPFSVTAPLLGQDRDAHRRQMVRLVVAHGVQRLLVSDDLSGIVGVYPETPPEMALAPRRPTAEELADDTPLPAVEVAPDDPVFVQFSSGSTSQPKGAPITHRGLVHNLYLIADNDGRTPESTWVSWLPLYHDMGLVGGLLTNLLHKNALYLMHPRCFIIRPISWLAAITRHRGNVTAIPNFALDLCVERVTDEQLAETPLDLSTFRYVYNGAEPVRLGSLRRFEEKYVPHGFVPGSIYPVYGMAETTLIVSAPHRDEPEVSRRIEGMDVPSVGYPLDGFAVEVRDDDGRVLGADRVGEIHIKGICVTPGYLDPSGASDGLIRDGWLATGDLGMLDAAGRLYITGRKKDLLIVQGRNFYGHDIAATLETKLKLRSGGAYVFGLDRDGREQVIVMLADPGADRDPKQVNLEVRRAVLHEFGLPVDDVLFVPRIPKTTSGKVVRHVCQQMYLAERG